MVGRLAKEASLVKRVRALLRARFPASHLQDAVSDEEQAGELGWGRGREVSAEGSDVIPVLTETGGGGSNLPFCSFDIFDITTGILCSAPP